MALGQTTELPVLAQLCVLGRTLHVPKVSSVLPGAEQG